MIVEAPDHDLRAIRRGAFVLVALLASSSAYGGGKGGAATSSPPTGGSGPIGPFTATVADITAVVEVGRERCLAVVR
jgi:hypothetical protein